MRYFMCSDTNVNEFNEATLRLTENGFIPYGSPFVLATGNNNSNVLFAQAFIEIDEQQASLLEQVNQPPSQSPVPPSYFSDGLFENE